MADDEQFSLCWNNFNTNLSAGFHESLIQGDLVDVTLAAEGQLVKAHRLILSVCSPYFRKMFTQMPANQHAFIFLKDVSHSALKDLIQFMYCGEVNVKQDALPAFISTAEALQIKGLTETGESAPAQQSPAKDTSHHLPSSGVTTIPSSASSPRAKPVQRSRIQSYKIDSDNESEHEKVVQIQATSTSTNASSSSTGPSATIVATQVSTAPQQVQIIQQQQQAQKRTLQQRASITPQTTQIMKRAKLSDPLEAPEPAQIQTVQIVKQITQTPQPTISSEPEYVEMPIETINPKAEPDYVDDPSEVEAIETEHEHEHEHEQALTEHEAAEHEQDADDNYVEDETYGEMAKYDESYFTEGEEVKAGASGFGSESYTDCGTAADQAAQDLHPLIEFALSATPSPIPQTRRSHKSAKRAPPKTKPFVLDDQPLVLYESQRGKYLLVLENFTFSKNNTVGDTTYWACRVVTNHVQCKARANTTQKTNGLFRIMLSNAEHNHLPKVSSKTLVQSSSDPNVFYMKS
ncbi:modifier of mdg4-like isoform X10 [Toxorhynchites rutilus septentrionalis]|uniref:modifier of mdg4-like isoform X10 n=1 Tax=Toxorhynchites rutilus septentrionalis TaxID=329112 RepID=UPI002479AFF4|nr:modifier of mdg4-like isoform X10 [Toxorhynchites rutilus septentrionalis]